MSVISTNENTLQIKWNLKLYDVKDVDWIRAAQNTGQRRSLIRREIK
jgi:hypothetical protein